MPATWDDELPVLPLPQDPAWRENFCFDGYDAESDVGFWIHMARWARNRNLWREQVFVYLPNGQFIVHRGYGYRDSSRGPSSAALELICERPDERWRIRFDGPGQSTTLEELQRGPLAQRHNLLLNIDIEFSSSFPTWNMTEDCHDQPWAKFHTEQNGFTNGTITFDGKAFEMKGGHGWHDHSRGPRDFIGFGRHCWIQGGLSKGRSFAITALQQFKDGKHIEVLNKAAIWDGGRLFEASCPSPPYLISTDLPPPTFPITLEYERGTVEAIGRVKRNLPHTTSRHAELLAGIAPEHGILTTYKGGVVFVCDGEHNNGSHERSFHF